MTDPRPTPPVALTIAGSDSGGGAGIAADLRTFAAKGVFGTLVLTAATAQSTEKVYEVVAMSSAFVDTQIEVVLDDFDVKAAKTGMLATCEIVEHLARRAAARRLPPLVVDPVLVSSSGSILFDGEAMRPYRQLLAHAIVATPNLAEAEVLLARSVRTRAEMADAAKALVDLGVGLAVVKGGHLRGTEAIDVCYDGTEVRELASPMIDTRNVHGTGCTLSAAITANIARGMPPLTALQDAKAYVTDALRGSAGWALGRGPGPLDHFPTTENERTGR